MFGLIVEGLGEAMLRRASQRPGIAPLMVLLLAYLRRLARRFATVVERGGRPAPARPKPEQARPNQPRPDHPRPDHPRPDQPRRSAPDYPANWRVPRAHAWLLPLVPEAAWFGSHLEALLADPAMAGILQASPHATRIIRPICRTLGITPPPPPSAGPPMPPPGEPTPVRDGTPGGPAAAAARGAAPPIPGGRAPPPEMSPLAVGPFAGPAVARRACGPPSVL